ncbi:DNA mismatch endonuclease Vsr [Candidatus Binatus sp.]|uniref:DNA mismatch endonuclease Vsr n=1 Tax=Candidatus Binatus sp. TaxID=2811406 RepID=UPI003C75C612
MTIFGATKITLLPRPKQVISLPGFAVPPPSRRANMRAIKARGNRTTEARLRALLVRAGIRGWKLQALTFAGTPDFLFADKKIAVFTHGCFWHGCPRCGHLPRTNSAYWGAKIARNQMRDRRAQRALRRRGYMVVAIWECQLRRSPSQCLRRIADAMSSQRFRFRIQRTVFQPPT